jgi:hypothetical protein
VRSKLTYSLPSHSSQAKTDFLISKPFQSGQNQLPPFQAIPVRPKLTSSIPGHSRQAKTDFLYSKPFQSGQNRLFPFQAIPVGPKPISSSSSYSSQAKTDFLHSKPFQSGQNQLPSYQAIPVRPKTTFFILCPSSQASIVKKSSILSLPCRIWSPNYSVLVQELKQDLEQKDGYRRKEHAQHQPGDSHWQDQMPRPDQGQHQGYDHPGQA